MRGWGRRRIEAAWRRGVRQAFRHDTVQEIESAITRLSPAEMRAVATWPEDFLEDQLGLRPEFVASIGQGKAGLAAGLGRRANP